MRSPQVVTRCLVTAVLVAATVSMATVEPVGAGTVSVGTEAQYRAAVAVTPSEPYAIVLTADITLTAGGDPTYSGTQPLTLDGDGHTIDANHTSRVLHVSSTAALTVQDITIRNGNSTEGGGILAIGNVTVTNSTITGNTATAPGTSGSAAGGGGIRSVGGVTVTNSTITGNTATGTSNGSAFGGGISSSGGVTVTNSTITGNAATATGTHGFAYGGGISSSGGVTVTNSTITGNAATAPGGLADGAGISSDGAVTVTNGTITDNTTTATGTYGSAEGGGISSRGAVTVTNSTITDNTATATGTYGFASGGGISDSGVVTVTNSTITDNTATAAGDNATALGGGINSFAVTVTHATVTGNNAATGANLSALSLVSSGSVVAGPMGGTNCSVSGSVTSAGYNWVSDGSCGLVGTGDTIGADPQLGALADNGGPTRTRLPVVTSPLVDAIPNGSCPAGLTTDQRGQPRPSRAGGACDIGAVEGFFPDAFTVSDEAEYRAALAAAAADPRQAHTITLDADITLVGGTDPTYSGAQALTINGDGHRIAAGGTSRILARTAGTADLRLRAVELTGGATAGRGGAVYSAGGEVILEASTLTANTARDGGAVSSDGLVRVTNSTVTANTANRSGGGIASNRVFLHHATVAANSAPEGANLAAPPDGLETFASVLADPRGRGRNCATTTGGSGGYNYVTDESCGLTGPGDTHDPLDPGLGPLGDNGGPTPTRAPQADSPLIDAVPTDACHATTDQRGVSRPRPAGGDCDIGAVEHDPTAPRVALTAPRQGKVYARGQIVAAAYTCVDEPGGSGIPAVGCVGTVANGSAIPTATVGAHTFTVTATDRDGNSATRTHAYTVALARPDGRIQRGATRLYGNDIYNTLTDQTATGAARPGASVTYYASIQNDAAFGDTIRLRGAGSTSRFTVTYRNPFNRNITTEVRNGTYTSPTLAPGATHRVEIIVTVLRSAPAGSALSRTLEATSVTHTALTDTVKFVTRRS